MLGVGKIAGGGDSYYLEAVASGADEYYRGVGEAPGVWMGSASIGLGLCGEVEPDDLKAIWNGIEPSTGERLGAFPNRTIDMFDLCFKAPKSVSLLFAFADPDIAAEVRDGHDAAVTAALGYLEREAVRSRAGKGGARSVEVTGLVAAAFRHRTSRTGDPHLHTHVLAANAAKGVDGKWRTLNGTLLLHHALTAGYLYQAQLRRELTDRLGVAWHRPEHGVADMVGIDRSVIEGFSDRRRQIQEHLDEVGFRSARAAQIATLDTRIAKDETDPVSMRDVWLAKADELGFDPAALDEMVYVACAFISSGELSELFDRLRGPGGLTKQASTFDRRDVLRAVAGSLSVGGSVDQIEEWATDVVASPDVVRIHGRDGLDATSTIRRRDGRVIAVPVAAERWSTVELIEIEQHLIDTAVASVNAGVGVVPEEIVEAALAKRPSLRPEQIAMIARLTTSGAGIDVVSAAAGTGKTFGMDGARDAWQAAGFRVLGASLAAEAAHELQSAAGIPSTTLARLDLDLWSRRQHFDARTVLVIDEASMAGTRALANVMHQAIEAGTKVVLIGDPKQLPEIDAGGVLHALTRRLEPIELTDNRRQSAEWERAAVAHLRDGDIDTALDAYRRHGRLITAETAGDVRTTMVADWWAWRTSGAAVRMMAIRHGDVDDLNGRARAYLTRAELVHGPTLDINGRPFQAGDDIICGRNNGRLGVRNGMPATITAVDPDTRTLTIRTPDDRTIDLPSSYLDRGWVAHGYAATVHKTQGKTVDHALLLGSDELYRSRGYVGMSRGRHTNHLYVIDTAHPDRVAEHHPHPAPVQPFELITAALRRDDIKQLAIDTGDPVDLWTLDQLVAERDRLLRIYHACPDDRTIDQRSLRARRDRLTGELEPKVKRYNELADRRVRLPKHRAEMITLQAEITSHRTALDDVERELDTIAKHHRNRNRYIDQHQPDLDRWDLINDRIDTKILEHVDRNLRRPPPHLVAALGTVPGAGPALERWRRNATLVDRYRLDHHITGPEPFGHHRNGQPAGIPLELRMTLLEHAAPTHTIAAPDVGLGL